MLAALNEFNIYYYRSRDRKEEEIVVEYEYDIEKSGSYKLHKEDAEPFGTNILKLINVLSVLLRKMNRK